MSGRRYSSLIDEAEEAETRRTTMEPAEPTDPLTPETHTGNSNHLIADYHTENGTTLSPQTTRATVTAEAGRTTATLTPQSSLGASNAPRVSPMPVKHTAQTTAASQPQPQPITESSGPVPSGNSAPTESHALATADHDEKGAVQVHGQFDTDHEVKDLGWNEAPEKIPAPLVGGLPNDQLWMLVRRFNKQMYHVKAIDHAPPGGLDLNVASEDEFSPDKLRSNVERLYMTVIVGMAGFAKHIARLRSWGERRRTAAFATAYFIAWAFDMVMPLIISTLITLVVYPPSRNFLFPPAPLALIDAHTGGIKNPTAGVLGSHGSLTGAPEKRHGEAVEQEAHSFVSSFGAIALSSAAGKHPGEPAQEGESKIEGAAPDPTSLAMRSADATASAGGDDTSTKHDKAKKPIEEAMWEKSRPAMHIIGDVADVWERLANALSPTPPFTRNTARPKLAGVLVLILLFSCFVNAYVVTKAAQFFVGAGFFGDPLIQRGLAWLNRNIPNWEEYLDIRNSLLKGTPTNAQLTITLLRIGEASRAPLPPPPSRHVSAPPAHAAKPIDPDTHTLPDDATAGEVASAIQPDTLPHTSSESEDTKHAAKPSMANKIISFFKGTTKTGVNTALSTDPIKASIGSKAAQNRLGVVPSKDEPPDSGPLEFPCRFHGKKGLLRIITSAASPCISFAYKKTVDRSEFVVPIPDIRELKKVGGLGWKSKLIVGWSMDRNVVDGLSIVTNKGEEWHLTAVQLRDELFNRLVAMGGQKWESW